MTVVRQFGSLNQYPTPPSGAVSPLRNFAYLARSWYNDPQKAGTYINKSYLNNVNLPYTPIKSWHVG